MLGKWSDKRIQTPAILITQLGSAHTVVHFLFTLLQTYSVTEVIFMLRAHFLKIGKFIFLWLTMSFCVVI